MDVGGDDLPYAGILAKEGPQLVPGVGTRQHYVTCSEQAQDPGRSTEGAKHEGDAAVLEQVRRGLVAAAGQIQIGHASR